MLLVVRVRVGHWSAASCWLAELGRNYKAFGPLGSECRAKTARNCPGRSGKILGVAASPDRPASMNKTSNRSELLRRLIAERIVIIDGAAGSSIQDVQLTGAD